MSDHVEREFKLPLSDESQFAAVLERLRGLGGAVQPAVLQVNHFFDTEELALRSERIALRLRAEGGRHELGLKGPSRDTGAAAPANFADRPEEEIEIDAATARALLAGEESPLAPFARSARAAAPIVRRAQEVAGKQLFVYLGSFENERTRIGPVRLPREPDLPPLLFELDRTRFSAGRVERELEVELAPEIDAARVEAALGVLFHDLALAPRAVPSKAERFFRALDEAG